MKAIIFDLDGVLIDACEWHYEALNKALEKNGFEPINRDDHIKVYNGLPTKKKLKIMGLDDDTIKKVSEDKKKFTNEIIGRECSPDEDKMLLLDRLVEKYQLGCCSNAIKSSVVEMLTRAGLVDNFTHIMGNDEGFEPKPSPESYLAIIKEMGFKPKDCLIVEDAPHGIEAAKASGAMVLAVKGYKDVNSDLFERLGVL